MEEFFIVPGDTRRCNQVTRMPALVNLLGVPCITQLHFADPHNVISRLNAVGLGLDASGDFVKIVAYAAGVAEHVLVTGDMPDDTGICCMREFIASFRSPETAVPVTVQHQVSELAGYMLSYRVYGKHPWPTCNVHSRAGFLPTAAARFRAAHPEQAVGQLDVYGIADFICSIATSKTACMGCQMAAAE